MSAPAAAPPRLWKLLSGPVAAGLVLVASPGDDSQVARMAAITVWMTAWWITEAVPVPVTALLPIVLIPLAGIAGIGEVTPSYGREIIFLFLGGFLLALGLQRSGVHRRIALAIVAAVGSRPRRLVLGFMLAAGGLSMWLSNTSTTLLLLPIALSLLATAADQGADPQLVRRFGVPLMLSIAHGSTIGGMATPVGTPTNLVFRQLFPQLFPGAPVIGFPEWMAVGLPISLVYILLTWLLMTRVIFPVPNVDLLGGRDTIAGLREALGPLRRDELVTSLLFAVTALLWLTGKGFQFGSVSVPGWQPLLDGRVDDNMVAIGMAGLLFAIPSRDRRGERLLEWRDTVDVPWGILLLFGGGFALAGGFERSGLSAWASSLFLQLEGSPTLLVVVVVCLVLVTLSEFASNTATAQIALPILASAALSLQVDPRLLMIPATFCASCAFMMPVGTPPISIVFASGYVSMADLWRSGLWINLLGVLLVTVLFWLLAGPIFGIDPAVRPTWAAG
jgi:sodium-dependent dicarboxylate transporter 2/3/5